MRKFIYSLFLTVLLGIPLSTKATIVDDPGVFNFAPFYDPSSGVIGLSQVSSVYHLRFSLLKRETRFTFLIISMKIISTNMFLSLYSTFIVYNK